MQEESKSFYKILQNKSPELASQLDLIKKRGVEMWLPMIHFDKGSHGGYPQIRNVERNADKLVPDKVKEGFSAGEIYLLLSAIFLHDVGKVILDNFYLEKKEAICPINGDCSKWNDEKICSMFHIYHSEKIIRESWGMLGLPDERIAEYCAAIVYCHALSKPPGKEEDNEHLCSKVKAIIGNYKGASLEPYGKLRIKLLAAILRLADEADNCWMRSIPSYLLEGISEDIFNPLVKAFRRWVDDVEFCYEGKCIIMHIPELKNEGMKLKFGKKEASKLTGCKNAICDVLKFWMAPLKDEGIYYDHVFFGYEGNLYKSLKINETRLLTKQKLTEAFESDSSDEQDRNLYNEPNSKANEMQKKAKEITRTVIKLLLISADIKWPSIREFISSSLTDYKKWLAERIGPPTNTKLLQSGKLNTEPNIKESEKEIIKAENETQRTIKEIVKAVIKLYSGSMGYDKFRWRSIEEFVGHPLNDYDKWLAGCIGPASDDKLKIEFIPGEDEQIRVAFDKSKLTEIYDEFDIDEE